MPKWPAKNCLQHRSAGTGPMPDTPLIRGSPPMPCDCRLSKSLELFGDRWTLLVLWSRLYGIHQFDDFQAEQAVPQSVLSTGRTRRERNHGTTGVSRRRPALAERVPAHRNGASSRPRFLTMTECGGHWLGDGEPAMTCAQSRAIRSSRSRLSMRKEESPSRPIS